MVGAGSVILENKVEVLRSTEKQDEKIPWISYNTEPWHQPCCDNLDFYIRDNKISTLCEALHFGATLF